MKNYIFTFLMLLSCAIAKSQSFNSICWPPSLSNIHSCDRVPFDMPILDEIISYPYCENENDCYIDLTYVDSPIINSSGECEQLIRNITILDWLTLETHQGTILYNVDESLNLAKNSIYIHGHEPFEDNLFFAHELVKDPQSNHIYSFSSKDTTNTTFLLPKEKTSEIARIYEHTTNSWYNSTQFTRTGCLEFDIDSVAWPPQVMNIPSCSKIPDAFPLVHGIEYPYDDCLYLTYQDEEQTDSIENCIRVNREISILDWYTGIYETNNIIYEVNQNLNLAKDTLLIPSTYPPNDVTISANELVVDPIQGYVYSSSSIESSQNTFSISSAETEKEVIVFEHTKKNWYNPTIIKRTPCLSGFEFSIHSSIYLEIKDYFDGYVNANKFDKDSYFNCGEYSLKIGLSENGEFKDSIFFEPTIASGNYEVFIQYRTENGFSVVKKSFINISINIENIFTKYIELKEVIAGEETEVTIWSSGIKDLVTFMYALKVQNAEYIGISSVNPKFPFNMQGATAFVNDEFRTAWSNPNPFVPIEFDKNEEWFNIKIIPSINGLTSDIFSWADVDFISEIAIEDENTFLEIDIFINFELAVKPSTTNVTEVPNDEIEIYPNPCTDKVYLKGVSSSDVNSISNLQNIKFPIIISDNFLITDHLPNGIYFVSFVRNEKVFTNKIIVAR